MAVKGNAITIQGSDTHSGGVGIGQNAVGSISGVGIGYSAGRGAGGSVSLVAIGYYAGYISGSGGVCVGQNSATYTDWGAVAIGVNSNAFAASSVALGTNSRHFNSHCVGIGFGSNSLNYDAVCLGSFSNAPKQSVMLGSTSVTNIYIKGSTSNVVDSDIMDKTNILSMSDKALNFINQIQPITYYYNYRMDYQEREEWALQNIYRQEDDKEYISLTYEICNISKKEREKRYKYGGLGTYDKEAWIAATKKKQKLSVGFKAQEILQILNNTYERNYQNLLIDDICQDFSDEELLQDNAERQYGLAEGNLIPFLVKAIQELNAEIDILEEELKELE